MKCPKCGLELNTQDSIPFCPGCGEKLSNDAYFSSDKEILKCDSCGSINIDIKEVVETVDGENDSPQEDGKVTKKEHGILYKLCIWWWWAPIVWCCKKTWGLCKAIWNLCVRILKAVFGKREMKSSTSNASSSGVRKKICVCKNCGQSWNYTK